MKSSLLLTSALLLLNGTCINPALAKSASRPALPPPPPVVEMRFQPEVIRPMPPVPAATPAKDVLVLGSGGPYTSRNMRIQRFTDYVDVKASGAPIMMTITNNGFSWFRITIANQMIATEKTLAGKREATINLTDTIQSGSSQIAVEGAGYVGATLSWKVTTKTQAKLTSVTPDEAIVGDTVKLKGERFSTSTSEDKVYFNSAAGQVISATATEIKVKIPTNATLGDNNVYVKVTGVDTNKIKMKIRGIPEVSGTNIQGVPPGQQVIIFGKNFSSKLGENKVYFGDTPAEVVAGTESQLTVIAPTPPYHAGHTPSAVRVEVGKIKSKNSVNVQIGPQMFADPSMNPGGPGYDVPSLPVGF